MPLYIGIMSGTSLDAVDIALCDISDAGTLLRASYSHEFSPQLKHSLMELCQPGNNEIERLGIADRTLALSYAEAVNTLLSLNRLTPSHIRAIGCHGQTIRHRPPGPDRHTEQAFTLQIGDANTLAARTGITTVADFRRRDIAEGGQGAPLAPAFHQDAFGPSQCCRAIVNIGGMANISVLTPGGDCTGHDTGPGNILMDAWIRQNNGQAFDAGGQFARQGNCNAVLLQDLLNLPFLSKHSQDGQGPRSTGREDFDWPQLQTLLEKRETLPAADVQATLLELTAITISRALLNQPNTPEEVFVCGGGAYNTALMERLQQLLAPASVLDTRVLGIAPEWVEAAAFAWLAHRRLEELSGNIPAVTGAAKRVVLGAVYPA